MKRFLMLALVMALGVGCGGGGETGPQTFGPKGGRMDLDGASLVIPANGLTAPTAVTFAVWDDGRQAQIELDAPRLSQATLTLVPHWKCDGTRTMRALLPAPLGSETKVLRVIESQPCPGGYCATISSPGQYMIDCDVTEHSSSFDNWAPRF